VDRRAEAIAHALTRDPAQVRFVRAPGRVNLVGDHTDYCEGFVLPMAIDLDCLLGMAARADGRVRARSLELGGVVALAADGRAEPDAVEPDWGRFVAGALRALTERGTLLAGVDLAVSSTVPAGSGLSSSSALAVALVVALAAASGFTAPRRELARIALRAEVLATGVPGGLMDQLAALYGQSGNALLIDCRDLRVDPIPLPPSVAVVVVHSGLPRTLAGSAYAERRRACEAAAARLGVPTLRDAQLEQVGNDHRARHVVTENARVLELARALRDGNLDALGPIMRASHASLRDDFDVSTPELDRLVELLTESGALGARLTGAGFGGCVVALVEPARVDAVLDATLARYRADTGLDPTGFEVRASEGAGFITVV
jgi:galactokinase